MKIVLKTKVKGHYKSVMDQFDRDLFVALAPKSAKMRIIEFTGSQKGDRVHIQFVSPFKADWKSDIVEHGSTNKSAWFVDKGTQIPFGLKIWVHQHIVNFVDEESSEIVDDIEFHGRLWIWTILMFIPLYMGFYPRKKIYQNYFGNPIGN